MGGVCPGGTKTAASRRKTKKTDTTTTTTTTTNVTFEAVGRSSGKLKPKRSFNHGKENGSGNSNSHEEDFGGFPRTTPAARENRFVTHSGELLPLSFSREFKPSTPFRTVASKDNQKTSFIGKAATVGLEKAVEVLDTLGSSMSNLNPRSGFVTGIASRGNRISILAFEVANTIAKGANLFQSLSNENIEFLKKEVLHSEGVRRLVSTDMRDLTMIAAADKREEFDVFTREVIRFGDLCKDPQWHNLGRFFSKLDTEYSSDKLSRAEAEVTMHVLTTLVQHTSELYHELHALDRFDQDYHRKLDEMQSLQLPQRESLGILQSELKDQKRLVRSLKKKSLWYKTLEEIMEKLVDVVTYLHQAIVDAFGHSGAKSTTEEPSKNSLRLGAAGLALHYANVINQIDNIASRPTSLPPNIRDTLYHGLPTSVKTALRSKVHVKGGNEELTVADVKAEMEKTLHWLVPVAANTTKAHQGFGWVGEWANNGTDFGKNATTQSTHIRLQTLYHADKQKTELHILELVTWLQRLINIVRQRDYSLKPPPNRSPTHKGLVFRDKTEPVSPPNHGSKGYSISLSEEDRDLLAKVSRRRLAPGVSKSQEFAVAVKSRRVWALSRSTGTSPVKEMSRRRSLEQPRANMLDVMDGLEGT